MGLFAKKFKPMFTDVEFVIAKESEIVETLMQEKQLGMPLFTPEQRKAVEEGRRATFLAVNVAMSLPAENGNSPIEGDQRELPDQEGLVEALEPVDLTHVNKFQKDLNQDAELMGEKRLRKRIKFLEDELTAREKFGRVDKSIVFLVGFLAAGGLTTALWMVRFWLDRRSNLSQLQPIVFQKDETNGSAAIAYEQSRGRQLESNFAVSEYYRQADNCNAGLERIFLKSENFNLRNIQDKPKTPDVCKDLAEYEVEMNEVINQCQTAVAYATKDVIEPRILAGIEKNRANRKQKLNELPLSYAKYLKDIGYGQCPKLAKKK